MTWPTLTTPSAANFLDHFSGASLNARWSTITAGAGAVTVTDSYAQCADRAGVNAASAFYYGTKINKTKNQLWMACVAADFTGPSSDYFFLWNGASAPTATTYATFHGNVVAYASLLEGGSSDNFRVYYYTSGGTKTWWDGSGATWNTNTGTKTAYSPCRTSDYYIVGFEIDATNARFRWLGWAKTYTGGYTFEQGWRLYCLTDWVNFSACRTSTDLWLVLGNPFTGDGDNNHGWKFEWVRYGEAATPIEGWTASKASSSTGHSIRHHWSYDGKVFVPQDRATDALAATGAGWESYDLQAPTVVYDGASTDYLFYTGFNSSFNTTGIGVAKATHAVPQNGSWTRGASNPIISPAAGESHIRYSFAFKDDNESDTSKRWKLLFAVKSSADSKERIHLATAADPPDSSTWTRQGVVIDVGTAGANDENGATCPAVVRDGFQWEVYYEGWDASNNTRVLRAYGTSLTALIKDGAVYVAPQANGTTTLTANLTGRTVTVSSTTGFVQDGLVILDQDATSDNYGVSRVRKVASGTSLDLYHGLDGFTTTAPAKIRQLDAVKRFTPRAVVKVGSEWWFYLVIWGIFDDDATFRALCEQNALLTHSASTASGATPTMDYHASPVVSRGFNSDLRSVENMTLFYTAVPLDPARTRQTSVLAGMGSVPLKQTALALGVGDVPTKQTPPVSGAATV